MANDLCRRQQDELEPQPLGFVPTRAFWQGRSRNRLLAPWQASLIATLGVVAGLTSTLTWGWLAPLFCVPIALASTWTAQGLFERYVRRCATQGVRLEEPK